MGKLDGKVAIVTGATRGLGNEIAYAFIAEGAKVVTWSRDDGDFLPDGIYSLASIHILSPSDAGLFLRMVRSMPLHRPMDDPDFQNSIDILVNCAGVYGPMGPTETVDWQEYEETIRTNLLLPVMMCRAVVPYMRKQGYGKIIQVSGGGATKPTPNASAYAASKAGVVRFAETLAEELRGTGIDVNSMAPGALPTRIQNQILDAGPEKAGKEAYVKALQVCSALAEMPPEVPMSEVFRRATDLAVFLASAESDGITGKLISVWDKPNEIQWSEFSKDVLSPDWYTLRRMDARILEILDLDALP